MDHIKNLIGKLEVREDKSETRIENLEKLIKQVSVLSEFGGFCLNRIFCMP
jgi:hypothetical protein